MLGLLKHGTDYHSGYQNLRPGKGVHVEAETGRSATFVKEQNLI